MSTKHTPRLWVVVKTPHHRMYVAERTPMEGNPERYWEHRITPDWRERKSGAARGCSPTWYGFDKDEEANAVLIAAAPDLLAACQVAMNCVCGMQARDIIVAAIAKATHD